jgi:ABC-type glycerol-3-phosphate transport system substrate-binding protein
MLDPEVGMDQAAYYPRFFSSLAIEGYQFGMIPASSANVVYYNRDHFEQAGIEAPTTWADAWSLETFLENVRALAGVSGQYGVVFPANTVTPIGYGAGGTALNEDQTSCAFDSEEVEAALQPFVSLVVDEQVANPPEVLPLEMFNSGLASMMWGAMDNVAAISETINWGIMPWCATPEFAMTENYDRAWVISKSAPDPEAAYMGLKALTEKAASDIWGQSRFGVPNLIASAEGEAFNDPSRPPEHTNVWSETFGDINGHGVDVILPRGPIGDAWKGNFTGAELYGSLFSGQITARQFLDEGCTRVNDEIARLEWNAEEGLQRLLDSGSVTDPDAKVLS